MKLVIFGANGPSGKLLTQQALDEGHDVSAVTRHPDTFPVKHDRLKVVAGDVYEAADLADAIAGHDAVLSVLGVPYSWKPVTVYSQGVDNIMKAMRQGSVRRLICTSSGGTNPHWDRNEGIIFGLIIKRTIGRTTYADGRRMEDLVMRSELDWTIVRPARLRDRPTVSKYRLEEAFFIPGMLETARVDLADFILKEAVSPRYIHKAVAIATRS
jgi:putative NADH-flavin reductase